MNICRLTFEQNILKNMLEKELRNDIRLFGKDVYYEMKEFYCRNHCEFSFKKEEFDVEPIMSKGDYGFCVTLPHPNEATECKRIYAFLKKGVFKYYTIEARDDDILSALGLMAKNEKHFSSFTLCEWENNIHRNFGVVPNDIQKEREKVLFVLNR